jgi:hypothetical protein
MGLGTLRNVAVAALVGSGLVSVAAAAGAAAAPGAAETCPPSPKSTRVELIAAPESVVAGESVHFRIDNSTGPGITYGTPYAIQQCLGGVWVLASFSPPGPWIKPLLGQNPGPGTWWSAPTPTTAPAGRYRIRKSVRFDERGHSLYDDFDVVAAGI